MGCPVCGRAVCEHIQRREALASVIIENAVLKESSLPKLAKALSLAERLLRDARKAAEVMAEVWRINIRSEGRHPDDREVWGLVRRIAEEVAVHEITTKAKGGFTRAARFVGAEKASEILAERIRSDKRRRGVQPDEEEVWRLVRQAIGMRPGQGSWRNTEF